MLGLLVLIVLILLISLILEIGAVTTIYKLVQETRAEGRAAEGWAPLVLGRLLVELLLSCPTANAIFSLGSENGALRRRIRAQKWCFPSDLC